MCVCNPFKSFIACVIGWQYKFTSGPNWTMYAFC